MGQAQAKIVQLVQEEVGEYSSTKKREEMGKEYEFLQSVRDAGNWVPVESDFLRLLLSDYIETGVKFSEHMAEIDIRFWADKKSIKPLSYYQKRWKWGRKKTYNFLCERGLMGQNAGERQGNDRGTTGERRGNEIPVNPNEIDDSGNDRGTIGERQGNDRGTVYPDSDTDSEKKEKKIWPEFEVFPPENPNAKPHNLEEVLGEAAKSGVTSESATKFFYWYAARDWKDISNWRYALKSWSLNKPKHQPTSPQQNLSRPMPF